jgi:hypothetical protein
MMLVDTSVWIDHFRGTTQDLAGALDEGKVLLHPFVLGEVALGHLPDRRRILATLRQLPEAIVASTDEALAFLDHHQLMGTGVGYVDAHLLASTMLSSGASLWTRDKRLMRVAEQLGLLASRSFDREN